MKDSQKILLFTLLAKSYKTHCIIIEFEGMFIIQLWKLSWSEMCDWWLQRFFEICHLETLVGWQTQIQLGEFVCELDIKSKEFALEFLLDIKAKNIIYLSEAF